MKKYFNQFISLSAISIFFSCAGDEGNKGSATVTEENIPVVEEIIDTVSVRTMFMIVMGKESMIQGDYVEEQSKDEFMELNHEKSNNYEKLINVDVKGSVNAPKEDEPGFIEEEEGAIKYKMVDYDMLFLEKGEVEQPFRVSVVTKVKDYLTWKWLYDMEKKNRENAGMTQLQLGINKKDPNEIFMLIAIPDIARARELMEEPGLEKKMEQAGVIGKPIVKFWRLAGPQTEEL